MKEMILRNLTRKTTITSDLKIVDSLADRIFGLLKKSNPRSLLFNTRFGLHTFGLRRQIDVLVLSDDLKVVKTRQNLKPNRLFFWSPLFSIVIELPENSIKYSNTTTEDLLSAT